MSGVASVPITFGPLTGNIPLSDLDSNYAALVAYLNDPTNRSNTAADTGTTNAYVVTPLPAFTAMTAGQFITFIPAHPNTGASTINISALGFVALYKGNGAALITGDLLTTVMAIGVTDGTNVQLINPQTQTASVSKIVQVVNSQTGAVATGTTTIPFTNAQPTSSNGDQYLSLAITPTNTASTLLVEVSIFVGPTSGANVGAFLFQDANTLALAGGGLNVNSGGMGAITFSYSALAGTTSSTTFKVRAGGDTATTYTLNGAAGAAKYGGACLSSITITEIHA